MTRIYQLDAIEQASIDSTHVFPAEDNAGADTVQITLAQLCQYLFNGASVVDGSNPMNGFNLVVGNGAYANGSDSSAVGPQSNASDDGDPIVEGSSFGYHNYVSGYWGASAFGYKNYATRSRTTSFGHKNHANAAAASAIGSGNVASGYGSTASGYYNTASGDYACAFGSYNYSFSDYSTTVGLNNRASSYQTSAVGSNNAADGEYSSAFGHKNICLNNYNSAFGHGNITSRTVWNTQTQHNIVGVEPGGPSVFYVSGDQTQGVFYQWLLVENCDNSQLNGVYSILEIDLVEGNTAILVDAVLPNDNYSGGYILGDLVFNNFHDITAVDQGQKTFTFSGIFVPEVLNDGVIQVVDSTGNNGFYTTNDWNTSGENTIVWVNEAIPDGTADGKLSANSQADGSGWGASAFGYRNQANDSTASAFGHWNLANYRDSSAFGNENTTSNWGDGAFGFRNWSHGCDMSWFFEDNDYKGQCYTFGGYNFALGVENSAFGIENHVGIDDGTENNPIMKGSAFGYENNVVGFWGASAFGYRNHANDIQTSAFGHKNVASGEGASAIGNNNVASASYSTACGYNNYVTQWGNSAFGYENEASNGEYASAFGFANNAEGNYSTACGYDNTANGDYSTACGYDNTTDGNQSSAFGYRCQALANNCSAFGWGGLARWSGTTNIGGAIVARCDDNEGYDARDMFSLYAGVKNVIMSKSMDLTQSGTVELDVPEGCTFYVDEVALITNTNTSNVTVQPYISFGNVGNNAAILASVQTSGLTGAAKRNKFTSLLNYNGQTTLTATVVTGATADIIHGRFMFVGILVENTPSEF
jgi:hypothetical protein